MAGKRAFGCRAVGYVLGVAVLGSAPLAAETLPVVVRVDAKNARGVESRVVRDVQGRWETDGSFTGAFQVGGSDWSAGATVRGYVGAPRQSAGGLVPRGDEPGPVAGVTVTLGMAVGAISGALATDFTISICVDEAETLDLTPVPFGPPIVATDVVYGGSMAGGLIDGGGDALATVSTQAGVEPMYLLRTRATNCMGAVGTTAGTIYPVPSVFSVNSQFGAANVPQGTFGTPIPSAQGPDLNGGLELVLRVNLSDHDIVELTAVGRALGTLPLGATAPGVARPALPRGRDASAPALKLVERSELPGNYYLRVAVGHATAGNHVDIGDPAVPLVGPLTRNGGVVVGSLTAFGQGSCQMNDLAAAPIYAARIDGADEFPLLASPQAFNASAFGSTLIAPASFGAPIPNAVGPQIDSTIGMALRQQLGNDCLSGLAALSVVSGTGITPTPSITPTPTLTNTPTITPSPTLTLSPTATLTPSSTPTSSNTATPTLTLTPTDTSTPSNTPTISPTPTSTHTPTPTNTPTSTNTATTTPTSTSTPTPTNTPTSTNTATTTPTLTSTLTPSITPTPSNTPTPSITPEVSVFEGPPAIPTLNEVGLVAMLIVLFGVGLVFLLRARQER